MKPLHPLHGSARGSIPQIQASAGLQLPRCRRPGCTKLCRLPSPCLCGVFGVFGVFLSPFYMIWQYTYILYNFFVFSHPPYCKVKKPAKPLKPRKKWRPCRFFCHFTQQRPKKIPQNPASDDYLLEILVSVRYAGVCGCIIVCNTCI